MKLIEDVRAPNPRRVRIFVDEKGLEIEGETCDVMQLGHRTEDVAARNPIGYLPILVLDDGTSISETIAICRYLEALIPEPRLMGEGALGEAMVEMWQRLAEQYFFYPVAQSIRHLHPRFDVLEPVQIAEWGELNKHRAIDGLRMLDAQLRQSPFVAGEHFSVADITVIAAIEFSRLARLDRPEGLEGLDRWWAEVSARPSVAGGA